MNPSFSASTPPGNKMKSAAISSPNHLPIMVAAALAVLAGTSICRSETLFTQSMPAAPSPILVDCTIEGSAKKLMFDTGASMIALNPEYEREKSAVIGKGTDHSGKEFTVPTGVGPTIEIQSLEITKPTCMFVDLSEIGRAHV